jgi:hypothetical protein
MMSDRSCQVSSQSNVDLDAMVMVLEEACACVMKRGVESTMSRDSRQTLGIQNRLSQTFNAKPTGHQFN